jgi:GNAT superfamily N-acetyltransferase
VTVADDVGLDFARYDAAAARAHVGEFLELYAEVYGVPPYVGDPFFAIDTYAGRLAGALAMPGFEIVTASREGQLIGTGHGVMLPPTIPWWRSLDESLPVELGAAADQGRVFWLRELMVRERCRNKGLGRRLHDTLCAERPEDLVTMTVAIDNESARSVYLRWGYEIVGRIRHSPESPWYDAMVRNRTRP